ncbi:MAG TPA: branched-chain amino acid ABC transporter permease [Actinomycetota bacterium]|nr:branched-chain amino acid ABC transporter permease [Actinomycetota bacterium]
MKFYIQNIILGLPIGVIWALLATSVVMIYRASRVLNLAVGGISMISAYMLFQMANDERWGIPLPIAVVLTILFAAAIGWIIERILLRPLRDRPTLVSVIMTIGILSLTTEVASMVWTVDRQPAPNLLPTGAIRFWGIALGVDQILTFFITMAIVGVVIYLFRATTLGVAMRAVSDDRRAALLMGVPVDRVSSLTWIIGSVLGAIAGILVAPQVGLTPLGMVFQSIPALAAALFGGLVSIELAFGGAMVLGVLWSVLPGVELGAWRLHDHVIGVQQIAIFALVVVFLVVRWQQLFGSAAKEEEI